MMIDQCTQGVFQSSTCFCGSTLVYTWIYTRRQEKTYKCNRPNDQYKEAGRLGFRGFRILELNYRVVFHRVSSLRGNSAAVLSNIDCCEGFCVHQGLSGSSLRRVDSLHVACWIRSSSSGDVHGVIGRLLSSLTRCERSRQNSRIIGVILIMWY
jgi:hypothetical protein